MDSELLVDLPQVEVDGVVGHEEPSRGFSIRQSFGDERGNAELVLVQAVPAERCPVHSPAGARPRVVGRRPCLEAQQYANGDTTVDDWLARNRPGTLEPKREFAERGRALRQAC